MEKFICSDQRIVRGHVFQRIAKLQIEKGNKAAGMRARKASLELEKLLKQFRKESLVSLQMIPFGIRTYQVSSKKPLRFTAERLWLI